MEPDAQSFDNTHVSDDYVERMLEIAHLPKQLAEAALRIDEEGAKDEGLRALNATLIKAAGVQPN